MIWVRLDYALTTRRARLSRVPCVGERVTISSRGSDAVVWRVVHVEGEDVVAVVHLTSESGFHAMRREASSRRKPPL